MAKFSASVQVSLPADVKAMLRRRAREPGVSLSAVMRDIVDDLAAEHDFQIFVAQLEQQGVIIQ